MYDTKRPEPPIGQKREKAKKLSHAMSKECGTRHRKLLLYFLLFSFIFSNSSLLLANSFFYRYRFFHVYSNGSDQICPTLKGARRKKSGHTRYYVVFLSFYPLFFSQRKQLTVKKGKIKEPNREQYRLPCALDEL